MLHWWIILLSILVYILYVHLKTWIRTIVLVNSLPGPPVSPIMDNLFSSKTEFLDFVTTAYVKYGPIIKSWMYVLPIIFVLEPKHVQLIIGSSKFSEKSFMYNIAKPFVGRGLVTLTGKKSKSHRKHIQPFFSGNMLDCCIPVFIECSNKLLESLKNMEKIKLTAVMDEYVMDTICDIIVGVPLNDYESKAKIRFVKGNNVALERFYNPWLFIDFIFKAVKGSENDVHQTLEEFVLKIAKSRIEGKTCGTKWNLLEFLHEVSKSDKAFQMDDVVNEICSFIVAGQDTTKVTLAFSLYYLAKHQDVQNNILLELNKVMKSSNSVDMDVLNEMKYLEQCIKESMRLSPPAPIFIRQLLEDVKLDHWVLPAGCNVFISPYATHRIPKYYPEPEKFNPERFSKEGQEEGHNYAYLPFSGGPRNCIASKFAMLSMKTALSILLKNYKVSLESEDEPLIPTFRISLKAKGNICLKLQKRDIASI